MDVIHAHKFSSHHRDSILKSEKCGCFGCLAIFPPEEIIEWVDENENGVGQTALCPKCGIDSVIGSNDVTDVNKQFLKSMKEHWMRP